MSLPQLHGTTSASSRRYTRHKNSQLVAQICFVASFGSMFRVFVLFVCLFVFFFLRDQVVAQYGLKKAVEKSWERVYLKQQIFDLLLVFHQTLTNTATLDPQHANNQSVRCNSSTRNKCFYCPTSWSREVKKRQTSTPNLPRNNVARQVEGFCIPSFAAVRNWGQRSLAYLGCGI